MGKLDKVINFTDKAVGKIGNFVPDLVGNVHNRIMKNINALCLDEKMHNAVDWIFNVIKDPAVNIPCTAGALAACAAHATIAKGDLHVTLEWGLLAFYISACISAEVCHVHSDDINLGTKIKNKFSKLGKIFENNADTMAVAGNMIYPAKLPLEQNK
jgi:Flp pilus assembly pilin Flp